MGFLDILLMVVIFGAAGWLLYRSIVKRGACGGCGGCAGGHDGGKDKKERLIRLI